MHFQTIFHAKEVLHMFLTLFVKNCFFCLFDLEIDFLILKVTLGHKKNKRNG